ncbi:MAG: fibrobacter succinogenes major paralogous domain-containing protein [Bacteroidia bacterium]|nr:fibrobacter succinogenes major paralogous domain-containing protein [Bacteroidia bacterium]
MKISRSVIVIITLLMSHSIAIKSVYPQNSKSDLEIGSKVSDWFLNEKPSYNIIKERFIQHYGTAKENWPFFINESDNQLNDIVDSTLTDIDGNTYPVVQIENQLWMCTNLRTSRYNSGEHITPGSGMISLKKSQEKGMYVWYDNKESNGQIYGRLYNYYAVLEGCLCPEGWHVPSDEEWQKMIDYLGGEGTVGGKLKATGIIENGDGLWHEPNTGATNEISFNALPGGYMNPKDINPFGDLGKAGYWWTSTTIARRTAAYKSMLHNNHKVFRAGGSESNFYSVRCVNNK